MAVLLLLFSGQYQSVSYWGERFIFIFLILGTSMVLLKTASLETLSRWWVQAGLFLLDAALATIMLHWTGAHTDFYLIYFFIIFGTALTRSFAKSFLVALITSLLYLSSSWHAVRGFPHDSGFWLRLMFLWVVSALLAILSRDSQQAQADQENRFQERLIQFERLAALGQVAGEVAHRIKGPLTTILVNAEVLSQKLSHSKSALKELAQIQLEVSHCKEILKNLLDLGRIEEIDMRPMDLRDPIRSAVKSVEPRLKQGGISIVVSGLDSPMPLTGDQSLIHEAAAAVLHNAADASPQGGRISVDVQKRTPGAWWTHGAAPDYAVTIRDEGRGIEPADLERIFTAFFTTKGPQGSGLGLSAALRIIQKHGGTIEAHSDGPGCGARFTLIIPTSGRKPA